MGWAEIIAFAAASIAAALGIGAALSRRFDRSLSIREHEEFKSRMIKMIDDLAAQVRRDDDRIEREVVMLRQKVEGK